MRYAGDEIGHHMIIEHNGGRTAPAVVDLNRTGQSAMPYGINALQAEIEVGGAPVVRQIAAEYAQGAFDFDPQLKRDVEMLLAQG